MRVPTVSAWAQSWNGVPAALVAGIALAGAVAASGHAILYKRDDRGTMMWVGLIWALPLVGPALYLAFGINRIKRRAVRLRRRLQRRDAEDDPLAFSSSSALPIEPWSSA